MRRSSVVPVAFLVALSSCTEPTGPPNDGIDALNAPLSSARIIRIEASGFDDANNVGSLQNSQWAPTGWSFLQNSGNARDEFNPDVCNTHGLCHLGTLVNQWGPLGLSPFDEHNVNPNGGPSPAFAVMSIANFFPVNQLGFVRTMESGIENVMVFPGVLNVFLEFQIDAAFGTGQLNTGPTHNDYAVVEFVTGNTITEVLRWSRDDLQPGGQGAVTARSRLNCGTISLGGIPQDYPLCTGWERFIIPVNQFAGVFDRDVTVRIRIVQDGQDNDISSFLALDNVALLGYDIFEVPLQILAVNRLSKKFIEVAVLADGTFPISDVDLGSLRLDEQDVARLSNGTPLTSYADVNADGLMDVIARFDRQATLAGGTYVPGPNTLHLNGMLTDRSRIHGTAVLVLP